MLEPYKEHVLVDYLCNKAMFFFQIEATFPLVRKDYYIESLQGDLYTHRGVFLRSSKRR